MRTHSCWITGLLAAVCLSPSGAFAQDAKSILRNLDSTDYQIQRKAVMAAQKKQSGPILEKLLKLAEHANHPNIRGYACETLGHYRDPRIFALLKNVAAEKALVRRDALIGLGLLGDARSFAILVQALKVPNNWSEAAEGLRYLGDKRGAAALAKVLRQNLHDSKVFGRVSNAILVLDRGLAVELFFAVMQDESVHKYHGLHRLLGQVRTKEVRDRATNLLDHANEALQLHGIHILGCTADTRTVGTLLTVMEQAKDGSKRRLAAIAALGQTGHELAVPQLARHLCTKDTGERAAVAEALGKIGHTTATRPLILVLQKEDDVVAKLRLIEALGRVGDRRAIAELGDHLDNETVLDQPETISSIWQFPYNTPVHFTAWWAIQRIRSDGKEPCAIQQLFSPKWGGRAVTAEKIGATTKWWREHRERPGFRLEK